MSSDNQVMIWQLCGIAFFFFLCPQKSLGGGSFDAVRRDSNQNSDLKNCLQGEWTLLSAYHSHASADSLTDLGDYFDISLWACNQAKKCQAIPRKCHGHMPRDLLKTVAEYLLVANISISQLPPGNLHINNSWSISQMKKIRPMLWPFSNAEIATKHSKSQKICI